MLPSKLTIGLAALILAAPTIARADFWTENGCTLDKPQPVLKNGGFRLDAKDGTARESLKLSDAVTLRLEQSQCEYQTRTYTFILKEPPGDMDVVGWQYRKAVELLTLLENKSTPKLKFADEKKALTSYTRLVAAPKPEVEINVTPPDAETPELITVADQVGQQDTRIVVKIWSGPY
jgi:hypothetical protein